MEKDCQYLSWENAPIGPLLGHAAHLARERMDVRLARYDVTPAQTHVLLYLGEQSGPTPQRDVVEHLRVKPPTANGILDRLEEKKLAGVAPASASQSNKERSLFFNTSM